MPREAGVTSAHGCIAGDYNKRKVVRDMVWYSGLVNMARYSTTNISMITLEPQIASQIEFGDRSCTPHGFVRYSSKSFLMAFANCVSFYDTQSAVDDACSN